MVNGNNTKNGHSDILEQVRNEMRVMLRPPATKTGGVKKNGWGIDVETFWVPLAQASNIMGESDVVSEDLGAFFRLRRDKTSGEVKFSSTGRPQYSLAPGLTEYINNAKLAYMARANGYVDAIKGERPEAFAAYQVLCEKTGAPIRQIDARHLEEAMLKRRMAELQNSHDDEAIPQQPELAARPKTKARRKPRPTPPTPEPVTIEPTPEPIAVGAVS